MAEASAWFSSGPTLPVGDAPLGLIAEDFNNDGSRDVLTVNYSSHSVSVHSNVIDPSTGEWGFRAENESSTQSSGSGSVAAGDFDNDGNLDIATANNLAAGTVSILLGIGNGTFTFAHTVEVGQNPTWIVARDYDGDGELDLLVVNEGSDSVSFLKGNGDGHFSTRTDFPVLDDPYQVVVEDLNSDGHPDLAVSHGSGVVSFVMGDNVTLPPVKQVGWGSIGIIAVDVNADGSLDLVTANSYASSVSVLVNKQDGTFFDQVTYAVPSDSRNLTSGDLNGDGWVDLVVASWGNGTVSVLLNEGDGTFLAQRTFQAGSGPSSITTVDGNHDGVLDIAVANRYSNDVTFLFNDMLSLSQDGPVDEGSPVTVAFGNPSDPSPVDTAAGFHYAFAVDPAQLPTLYADAGAASSQQFTFADNGTPTVYGRLFDKDNGYTDSLVVIAVNNVAPSEVRLTLSAATINEGDSTTLSGSFVDPGVLDTHTVQIVWGDGSTPTTLELAAGVTSIPATTHQYLDNPSGQPSGSFPISVTVVDKDGDSGSVLSGIGPVGLAWAIYLGGSGSDQVFAIASDAAGNAYVMGQTSSTNLPQATNASHGSQDAFVAKVRADGSLAWTTYLGGSSTDGYANSGIAVDAQGDVVVCTTTWSTDFERATNAALGDANVVIAKLNSDGALQWATYVGGSGLDRGAGVAVDTSGNIFAGGYTWSSDFVGAVGAPGGGVDAFVAKLDSAGVLLRATYVGGAGEEGGHVLAVDSQGNAVITGIANSGGLPSCNNSYQGGPWDTFVAKVSSDASSVLWSTCLGGTSDEQGFGIAVDQADNILVTGYTWSTDLARATNSSQGGRDAFVARLTSAGSLDWATYLGGSDGEEGYGIAVDNMGNAFVKGNTSSTDFALALNQSHGSIDTFVTKVAPNGIPQWTTLLGGNGSDGGYSIAVDPAGNVLVPGWTNSSDFQGATNQLQGSEDGFVVKLTRPIGVTVNNVAPSQPALSLSASTIDENGNTVLSGSFTDPGVLDSHTVLIAWGDGTSETIALDANVLNFSQAHQYLDNLPDDAFYTITVSVTDKDSAPSPSASIDVTVNNVAPTEVRLNLSAATINEGDSTTLSGSFVDPGVLDTHTVQIEWGDGSTPTTLDLAAGVTNIPATTHQYLDNPSGQPNGSFPINVAVVDKDGDSGSALSGTGPVGTAWAIYLGGSGVDHAFAIASDTAGNAYVTGYTSSTNLPQATNSSRGGQDAFVAKVRTDGSLAWTTYLGGDGWEGQGKLSIAVDAGGNIFVDGWTGSSTFEGVPTGPGGSAYVAKLGPDGSVARVAILDGPQIEFGAGVAVAPDGSVFVSGATRSDNFSGLVMGETLLGSYSGVWDMFVAKLDSNLNVAWLRYLGGSGEDQALSVVADNAGNAIITGGSTSGGGGGWDGVVVSVSPSGGLNWLTYVGGSATDQAFDIAIDSQQNVWVAGNTYSANFPQVSNPADYYPDCNAFVVELSSTTGNIEFSSYISGNSGAEGYGIAVDGSDNVFVRGATASSNLPLAANTIHGGRDAFLTKFTSSETLVSSFYVGGSGDDDGYDVAVDLSGNALITGWTNSADIEGAINQSQGSEDGFIVKLIFPIDVTVNNVAPSQPALSLSASTIDENGTTVLSGNFTDPGVLDSHTVSINWGDGVTESIALDANVLNFSQAHQYLDNRLDDAFYTITVSVTDKDIAPSPESAIEVVVRNVAPTISPSNSQGDPALAPGYQLMSFTLAGTGWADRFGYPVGSFGDGVNVLVGQPCEWTPGHAYLFDASNGAVISEIPNPLPENRDVFGYVFASSGSKVLVGAHGSSANGGGSGTTYLYEYDASTRTFTKTNTFYGSPGDSSGHGVAFYGNDVLVTAPANSSNTGAVYLFDGTSQQNVTEHTFAGKTAGDWFGYGSPALAVRGNRVAIGAPGQWPVFDRPGAVYVYTETAANQWEELKIANPTPGDGDRFGHTVAWLDDTHILVGAPFDHSTADSSTNDGGAVYLYELQTSAATGLTEANLLCTYQNPSHAYNSWFGASLAAVDGNVLVGAFGYSDAGYGQGTVYAFTVPWDVSESSPAVVSVSALTIHNPGGNDGFGMWVAIRGEDYLVGSNGAGYLFKGLPANVVGLKNNGPVNEGSPVTVSFGTPRDPSPVDTAAGFRYAFAVDPAQLPTRYADAGAASSQQFTFADNGTPTVYGRIFDKDSGYTDYQTIVTVNNVAPSLPALSLSASPLTENGTTVLSGSFTDPGVLDTHTVTINWGDDATESIALAANVLNFSQAHQYLDNRLDDAAYTITVSVADKDGAPSPSASIDVTVTNVAPTAPKQPWFTAGTNVLVGAAPTHVISGDYNRDGLSDLLTVNQEGHSVSVRLGRNDGTFTDGGEFATGGVGSGFGATGDFNGDGFLDVATANVSSNNVSILLGNGNGTFGAPTTMSVGERPTWIVAVNYVGDANMDLLVVNESSDTLTVLRGHGDGTFTLESSVNLADDPYQVVAEDFNQDGSLDLAVSHGFGAVSFVMGNSVALPTQQVGWGAIGIIGADVNGDGWMDIVTANSYDRSVSVLVNNKRGSFRAEVRYPVAVDSRALVAEDFDGDNVVDLAVASWAEGTVSVLKGNGDGTFQAQKTFQAGSGPSSITTIDANHDGVLDIAVANRYSHDVTLLFNDMLSLSQDGPVNEGSPVTVAFGNPSDPSPVDTAAGFHYAFAVDPAQLPTRYADAGAASSQQFTFADNGTPTVYGRIFDKDSGYTDYRTVVTVNNVARRDISGRVFDDLDNDGLQDVDEAGIEGVLITLRDLNTDDEWTAITAGGGLYAFEGLLPGNYELKETQPSGYLDGKDSAGIWGGTVDNSRDWDEIVDIVFEAGDGDATGYDFAELRPSRILGLVWEDFNQDSEVNFGERAIEGVPVRLSGTDDRGQVVDQIMSTEEQGIYEFVDLRPGTYRVTEDQPISFDDGSESLGLVIPPPGHEVNPPTNPENDVFRIDFFMQTLADSRWVAGCDAVNFNFGERPKAGESVHAGQTATIGFWQNKNGQALIRSLNGGPASTQLAGWLAASFPHMYGQYAGSANLVGKTNAEITAVYTSLFKRNAKTAPGGPPKLDAQVLAVALAVYVTNNNLAGTTAAHYGFVIDELGVGVATYDIGDANRAAFGLSTGDSTQMTIMQILMATDSLTHDGLLYDTNGDHSLDTWERLLRTLANDVYSAINELGDI